VFNSAGPLRGLKRDLYEGGIRVPLLVRWPGKIPPGLVTDHQSAFWDFLPTASEIIGAGVPSDTDGISFLPTLLGNPNQKKHEYLYWEYGERNKASTRAVRWGDWKAVQLDVRAAPDGPVQLYNLKDDIGEQVDLAERFPEKVGQARKFFVEARTPSLIFPLLPDELQSAQTN
jgi:arylsulfatase A-like enzyme